MKFMFSSYVHLSSAIIVIHIFPRFRKNKCDVQENYLKYMIGYPTLTWKKRGEKNNINNDQPHLHLRYTLFIFTFTR